MIKETELKKCSQTLCQQYDESKKLNCKHKSPDKCVFLYYERDLSK